MIRTAAVVGTGLIGTSAGLALSRRGVRVHLLDLDASAARIAAGLGAGTLEAPAEPVDLALLAVPPTRVAEVLAAQQRSGLAHSYTDVASVKSATTWAAGEHGVDRTTYVGGHPLAGSERSGPLAARADLFEGRSWVLTPSAETTSATFNQALAAVSLCGATPVVMEPGDHDRAVALVSHLPHLVSALLAARLQDAPPEALRLAGQGLRDVTRIAGGDPKLWVDILGSNAPAVARALEELMKDLVTVVDALHGVETATSRTAGDGARATVGEILSRGQNGWRAVHGLRCPAPVGQLTLQIAVPDHPGELGRLLRETAEFGVPADGVQLCRPQNAARLAVRIAAAPTGAVELRRRLAGQGWRVRVVTDHEPATVWV